MSDFVNKVVVLQDGRLKKIGPADNLEIGGKFTAGELAGDGALVTNIAQANVVGLTSDLSTLSGDVATANSNASAAVSTANAAASDAAAAVADAAQAETDAAAAAASASSAASDAASASSSASASAGSASSAASDAASAAADAATAASDATAAAGSASAAAGSASTAASDASAAAGSASAAAADALAAQNAATASASSASAAASDASASAASALAAQGDASAAASSASGAAASASSAATDAGNAAASASSAATDAGNAASSASSAASDALAAAGSASSAASDAATAQGDASAAAASALAAQGDAGAAASSASAAASDASSAASSASAAAGSASSAASDASAAAASASAAASDAASAISTANGAVSTANAAASDAAAAVSTANSAASDASSALALAQDALPLSGGTLTGALVGTDLSLSGDLTVQGNIVSKGQVDVIISDSFLDLNSGNVGSSATAGGFTVNVKKATGFTAEEATAFVAGVSSVSAPSMTISGSSLAAGDIVQVSNSAGGKNDGLFVVAGVAGSVVSIKGIGGSMPSAQVPFVQNQLVAGSGETAIVVKVDLAAIAVSNGSLVSASGAIEAGLLCYAYAANATESAFAGDWSVLASTASSSLQSAYDNGDGSIVLGAGKPFHISGDADVELDPRVQIGSSIGFSKSVAAGVVKGDILFLDSDGVCKPASSTNFSKAFYVALEANAGGSSAAKKVDFLGEIYVGITGSAPAIKADLFLSATAGKASTVAPESGSIISLGSCVGAAVGGLYPVQFAAVVVASL
jgi:hypothetical protein